MAPPLLPMLTILPCPRPGPGLGPPPLLGIPPPRWKLPRLKPPRKAGGGRKPLGGLLNPPRGPGTAKQLKKDSVLLNLYIFLYTNTYIRNTKKHFAHLKWRTTPEVASVLKASSSAPLTLSSSTTVEQIFSSSSPSASPLWLNPSLIGLLLRRKGLLALLLVLFQNFGSFFFLQLDIKHFTEALTFHRQRVYSCKTPQCYSVAL